MRSKFTSRAAVDSFVDGGLLKTVSIDAPGRGISFYEWAVQPEGRVFHWVDIPTTMYVLRSNVFNRLGKTDEKDADLYREIELDEIEQFERALQSAIDRDEDDRIASHDASGQGMDAASGRRCLSGPSDVSSVDGSGASLLRLDLVVARAFSSPELSS